MSRKLRGGTGSNGVLDDEDEAVVPIRMTPRRRRMEVQEVEEDPQNEIPTAPALISPLSAETSEAATPPDVPTVTSLHRLIDLAPSLPEMAPPERKRERLKPETVQHLRWAAAAFAILSVMAVLLTIGWYLQSTGIVLGMLIMAVVIGRGIVDSVHAVFIAGVYAATKIKVYMLILAAVLSVGSLAGSVNTDFFQYAVTVAFAGVFFTGILAYTRAAACNLLIETD